MKRIHAFEFEDLAWFPSGLRNYATDFLQFGANTFDMYKPVIPVIQRGIAAAGNNTIIDIASGGGGGLLKLSKHLKKDNSSLKIVLSDYYPNIEAFKRTKDAQPDVFNYIETPVNAIDVPSSLRGFRTQFLSFHHFRSSQAKAILQNAIDTNQPIGIFEGQQRDMKSLVAMLLSPLSVLLMTPFIRPFRIGRIIFTYIIPVLLPLILWDGIISVLRTYSREEMLQMISELDNTGSFTWEVGVAEGKPNSIPYILGIPKKSM